MSDAPTLTTRSAASRTLAPVRDLRPLFDPRSLAVLGASNDPAKWGQWISAGALRGADRRDVWLVNRNGGEILGQQAFRSLAELPGPPELVVIAVPVAAFEAGVDDALAAGARGIVAITAGLGEVDDGGKELESRVVEKVRAAGAVMLGPNCLGVYDAAAALDLGMNEFTPGTLGIISQSGNLALELSLLGAQYGIGISRFASLGNQADIEAAELVEAFAADEHTRVIGVYCEDFRDGRAFARAGEAAQRAGKQVVLLAAGGSEAGARAAASHTGALASDSAAVEAACRAAGILRVTTPKQLIDCVLACLAPHRPAGPRVAIVGDGGGTGVVTADLVTEAGLELPDALARARIPPDRDRADDRHRQPRRSRRRRRAGLLELRAREHGRARVGRGRRRHLHRVLRRLQPAERDLRDDRDRGRPRDRARRRRRAAGRCSPRRCSGTRLPPARSGRVACPSTGTSRPSSIRSPASSASQRRPRPRRARVGAPAPPISADGYFESRELLAEGGVAFATARRATSVDEARAAAAELGYPGCAQGARPAPQVGCGRCRARPCRRRRGRRRRGRHGRAARAHRLLGRDDGRHRGRRRADRRRAPRPALRPARPRRARRHLRRAAPRRPPRARAGRSRTSSRSCCSPCGARAC